ncbi:MAG: hypothetical protein AAF515_20345 [Pseudomonadota bacterium]
MTQLANELDWPISGEDPDSGHACTEILRSYLGMSRKTPEQVQALRERDPACAFGALLQGYFFMLAANPKISARTGAVLDELESQPPESDWLAAHIGALRAWYEQRTDATAAALEVALQAHPQDLLSLRLLHHLYFYEGDGTKMRASLRQYAHHYRDSTFAGFVAGMEAFACEESGQYAEAEERAQSALAENPADAWAIHAAAHVRQSQHRFEDGVRWLQPRRAVLETLNAFRFHAYWHEALCHLALGDHAAALALFDDDILPAVADDFYLDTCNAAGLLHLLNASGVDVGDRWYDVARIAERHLQDRELVFVSLHYAMPFLGREQHAESAARFKDNLAAWSESETPQGQAARYALRILVPVLEGKSPPDRMTVDPLALRVIGGSHTQRALFEVLAGQPAPFLALTGRD